MPPDRFSVEEDEKLIELVSEHPLLWNMADSEWKNQLQKGLVWNKIGKRMKKTNSQCKTRWKSIRDHYKKQRKHEKDLASGSATVKKRAAYWDRLRFLETGEDECPTFCYVSTNDDTETPEEVDHSLNDDENDSDDHVYPQPLLGRDPKGSDTFRKPPNKKCRILKGKSVLEELVTERRSDRENLRTYLDKIVEAESEDENDLFFKTMAKTVKKFRPSLITEAKRKIFAIVVDLEEANGQRPI